MTKTLLKAFLDPSKPLAVQYGSIVGLASLGGDVVAEALLPNLAAYMNLLEPMIQDSDKSADARRCFSALLKAAGVYVHHQSRAIIDDKEQLTSDDMQQTLKEHSTFYNQLWNIFGDALLPFMARKETSLMQNSL